MNISLRSLFAFSVGPAGLELFVHILRMQPRWFVDTFAQHPEVAQELVRRPKDAVHLGDELLAALLPAGLTAENLATEFAMPPKRVFAALRLGLAEAARLSAPNGEQVSNPAALQLGRALLSLGP